LLPSPLPEQGSSKELRLAGAQVGCVLGKAGENIMQIRKVCACDKGPSALLTGGFYCCNVSLVNKTSQSHCCNSSTRSFALDIRPAE
jgi:hypothetical protein